MTNDKTSATSGHLVVIGSSAGGVEALSVLVAGLKPGFPAPIVIAQHLDPSRRSYLGEILERRTELPVIMVHDEARLEPGKIYLVPADRNVRVADGHVAAQADIKRPRPSIDLLLSSAAEAYGERLVAVILTGAGSDGAIGGVDVKNAGGVVVIQDPDTAAYPSMPLALPPTAVDHVSNLQQMAGLLHDLVTGAALPERAPEAPEGLSAILSLLARETNVDFHPYKATTVLRRVGRRMAVTRNPTLDSYRQYLEVNRAEVQELLKALLINVTGFFRDPEAFEFVKSHVLPELIGRERASGRTLRFWSAGCATGEEAYSLATLVAELLGPELPEWTVKIFATDVDEASITFARRGLYPANLLRNVPADYRSRFFEMAESGCHVSKVLRGMVIFGQQDLVKGAPFPRMDLVTCRNVLIYFKPHLQQEILDAFAFSLAPTSGYLLLGKAETARPSRAAWEPANKKWKIYRCAGSPAHAPIRRRGSADGAARRFDAQAPGATAPGAPAERPEDRDAARAPRRLNELLVRQLAVGVVLVDAQYRIQIMNGAARRLLGIRDPAHSDFLHSVRGLPYTQVRQALDSVFRERTPVALNHVKLDPNADGESRHVSLALSYLPGDSDASYVAITVTDVSELVESRERLEALQTEQRQLIDELGASNRRLQDLNKELQDANEELQATNEELMLAQEELQASNEEFEATNEELQATNEEMETSNEELQATNEELVATNEELSARTAELQEVAHILSGERLLVAGKAELAPFYVITLEGRDMRVKGLSPQTGPLFGGGGAVGRTFEDAAAAAGLGNLVGGVRAAYETGKPWGSSRLMAMVPEPEGRTLERGFMFTVVPTRNAAGEVTGTMVYAEDVTERSLYEREKSRERLRLMVEHAEQVALALFEASSGELLHASPRYVEMVERSVGAKREKVVGGKWQELSFLPSGREAWELFQDAVLRGEPRRLAEVRRPAVDGMESVWDCSLIPIPAERQRDTVEFVLVSAVEVTDQVRAREELQRLDRLKDEFLSMASHELRTPLVPLTTYTELLNRMVGERDKGAEWDKRFAEMMEKLRRQLRHLSRMTDDLLDVGRLQSGKFGLERTPVDLRALLPEIAVQARTLDSRRQLRVDVPAATDGVAVVGDEQRLTQVILNLVENAYKYGDPTEEVVLRASREEEDGRGWAVLEVEDGGPGIPEREQARLFKRFYQGSREGRPARRGLGLGLYIARAIVEQHEGSIDLDPEYRRGTRVRIRLPLAT